MGKFELMALPYAPEALEPVISKETIAFHHGKHLAAYVNNLNGLTSPPNPSPKGEGSLGELEMLKELVLHSEGAVFNKFTGESMKSTPKGRIIEAIVRDFGSFEAFKEEFQKKGATLFGSGWVWLSADKDGKLVITQEPNAANPIQKGLKPLLTFDVWEHAYYLDYQNRRPDHLAALWQIVDWEVIEKRYESQP